MPLFIRNCQQSQNLTIRTDQVYCSLRSEHDWGSLTFVQTSRHRGELAKDVIAHLNLDLHEETWLCASPGDPWDHITSQFVECRLKIASRIEWQRNVDWCRFCNFFRDKHALNKKRKQTLIFFSRLGQNWKGFWRCYCRGPLIDALCGISSKF